MKRVLLLLASSACATSAQSARPVDPGTTEVTVSLGRAASLKEPSRSPSGESDPLAKGVAEGAWTGELMIRHGMTDGFDGGLRLGRMPGLGGLSVAAVDLKVRVVRSPRVVVSLGGPAGIVWEETPGPSYLGAVAVPTLYLGMEVSPTVELVAAPKLHLIFARGEAMEQAWGLTIGPRFTEPRRRWAVHPELGITRFADTTLLLLGFSVSAGD